MSDTLSDPRSMIPAQLPPPAVLSRKAAELVDEFHQLDAQLPPRRSSEQLNALDELRAKALVQIGTDLETIADEEQALLETLRGEIIKVRSHWKQLESLRGLQEWQSRGMRHYKPAAIPGMSFRLGSGMTKLVSGRELIAGLLSAIGER